VHAWSRQKGVGIETTTPHTSTELAGQWEMTGRELWRADVATVSAELERTRLA
jgi:hypothetical protein